MSLRELSELTSDPSVSVAAFSPDFCNHRKQYNYLVMYSFIHNFTCQLAHNCICTGQVKLLLRVVHWDKLVKV